MSCLLPQFQQRLGSIYQTSGIDLILGAELYETIMLDARIEENNITVILCSVVIGGSSSVPIQSLTTCFSSMKLITEDTLKKFWEIEELLQGRCFTKEEQACEEHFQRTTKRNQDGQFVVKLPFKENATPPTSETPPRHTPPTTN